MDHLLPEVINRPLSIIRRPAGTGKPCFFQKHHTAGLELVDSVKLKEDSGINAHYLVVRDAASLLELVQFNALEFHPWGSHAEDPDRADRVVFDLDPGPDVPFAEVKQAASDIRKLLGQLSWSPSCGYPEARAFMSWCPSTRVRLGPDQALRQRIRRRVGPVGTSAVLGHRHQSPSKQADLCRLPA